MSRLYSKFCINRALKFLELKGTKFYQILLAWFSRKLHEIFHLTDSQLWITKKKQQQILGENKCVPFSMYS